MAPLSEPSFLGYDSKSPERGRELASAAAERIGPGVSSSMLQLSSWTQLAVEASLDSFNCVLCF